MYAVVKRLEDDYALCEINSQHLISIERTYLPREARKGCAFLVDNKIVGAIQEIIKRSTCEEGSPAMEELNHSMQKVHAAAR